MGLPLVPILAAGAGAWWLGSKLSESLCTVADVSTPWDTLKAEYPGLIAKLTTATASGKTANDPTLPSAGVTLLGHVTTGIAEYTAAQAQSAGASTLLCSYRDKANDLRREAWSIGERYAKATGEPNPVSMPPEGASSFPWAWIIAGGAGLLAYRLWRDYRGGR